ncbi:MAG: UPF0158 family protein [Nostoc sp. DedQUE04]|uniref:UPF0158 family protein n=1 Tax=Nostoc sp. DedQUE04 TaxID=3075390 RepID=UPI002AD5B097|nr:UPF0158 family protein [Nostoc sp. DedQUE04]MDZ8135243.1 UPF0158 family protein [Nostoc sp. DedQUE04]
MIKLNIDIDWIIEVLKNYNELGELIIDMESKVIHLSRDNEINDLDFEELESGNRYLQIPDLCDGSNDMELFIENIEDPTLHLQVENAFHGGGRGHFKRVKYIVGNTWTEFENEQIKKRLTDWLESVGIEIINDDALDKIRIHSSISNNSQIQEEIPEPNNTDTLDNIIDDFDPENIQDARKKIATSITRRQGQPKFRQQLLVTHNGKCAISGSDVEQALEAAHIIPYLGSETNHPCNGLLLRADLHTLFDLNLIAIDPEEMTVLIAPSLCGKYCEEFIGKKIYIPENPIYAPSKKALRKRYEQCEWLKQVVPLPSECVAVAWRFTGDCEGEYCTVIFWSVRLVGYESLYWWTNKFVGNQSTDFEKVKKQSIEIAETNKLPLLWGVGHLVRAGEGVSASASHQPMSPKNGFDSRVCNFYPVDEQGNQLELKSATTLKDELGLTSQQIRQLGEPDGIRKNPYYKNGHPMKLYSVDRVKNLFSI